VLHGGPRGGIIFSYVRWGGKEKKNAILEKGKKKKGGFRTSGEDVATRARGVIICGGREKKGGNRGGKGGGEKGGKRGKVLFVPSHAPLNTIP